MELKAHILGLEYDLVQGNTFAEEYNETLDSGTIIINGIAKIEDLRPYDDVFIWDSSNNEQFTGYGSGVTLPSTYYHLLVDQFTCEQLVLGSNLYKYTIQLFSETKGLENAQLPNISITQPLNAANRELTINYIKAYVGMYSPARKITANKTLKTYTLERKYALATQDLGNLKAPSNIFGANDYAPEISLNDPNLRDVLTQLMLTKDCIPVVKDDLIYCLDISARRGTFDTSKGEINYVIGSRSSDNHCDSLKRTYQNALGQENTCKYTEYLGFRNSDTGLMTLSNMRLETKFPIYKINKVLMCYYKKLAVVVPNSWNSNTAYARGDKVMYNSKAYICMTAHTSSSMWDSTKWDRYYIIFVCKQDITSLVLLNSYRNALSMDYDDISNPSGSSVTDIQDLARYKFCTVGYDIGSKYITGWGTTYSQLNTTIPWFKYNKSYIENILKNVDSFTPFGIYNYGYVTDLLGAGESLDVNEYQGVDSVVVGDTYDSNEIVKLKSLMFQIEYDGFYNGTILHSKDGARDNVVMNDNSSSSLTLLEKDGLFEKEKANRFGNEAIQINARYTNLNDLQPIGSVYGDDDVVIYHREYSIYNNVINCTYYGTKDYVLKNYFTSVYSKHRPFNLLSYGESTTRSENRKRFILLSKKKQYYQQDTYSTQNNNGNSGSLSDIPLINISNYKSFKENLFQESIYYYKPCNTITEMASCLNENEKAESKGVFKNKRIINNAFITDGGSLVYKTDLNKFVCGKSMCFNLTMYDNLGAGSSLKQIVPDNLEDIYHDSGLDALKLVFSNEQDDYTGSTTFYDSVYMRSNATGRQLSVDFYVCHKEDNLRYEEPIAGDQTTLFREIEKDYLTDGLSGPSQENAAINRYGLYRLPNIRSSFWDLNLTYLMFFNSTIAKDNKEQLDMTFQIEPITDDAENIFFSEWFMKLNNLITTQHKTDSTYTVVDSSSFSIDLPIIYGQEQYNSGKHYIPFLLIRIANNDYANINNGDILTDTEISWGNERLSDFFKYPITDHTPYISVMFWTIKKIVSKTTNTLQIEVDRKIKFAKGLLHVEHYIYDTATITLTRVTNPSSKAYDSNYYTYAWNFEDNTTAFVPPVDYTQFTEDGITYTIDQGQGGYWFCFSTKGKYLPYGSGGISSDNSEFAKTYVASGNDIYTTYAKNMFLAISDNKLEIGDEGKAYSNSADIDGFDANSVVGSVFQVTDEDYYEEYENPRQRPLITVDLHNIPATTKSISYYFYDIENSTYHFVFGVNVKPEDIAVGYMKIYLSDLITRDTRVFDADTHLIAGNEKNYVGTMDEFPINNVSATYE